VRTFLAISVSRIHTQLQRLFTAEGAADAGDCFINHPGGLLRHDIQIESVNGNGLKQLKKGPIRSRPGQFAEARRVEQGDRPSEG